MKILKGVEASIRLDGSFDTPLIDEGRAQWVNASIHPEIDEEGFKDITSNPKKYTDLVIRGIENPKTNNIGHIGFDCPPDLTGRLDWEQIAEAAIKNKVSIEINLKELTDYIYKDLLNYDKFPKNDKSYLKDLKEALPRLIPLLSDSLIRKTLSPYFERGLKIAINSDEHKNNFIRTKVERDKISEEYLDRDFRYWRILKEVENYFNIIFKEASIKKENIINTYSFAELEKFRKKEE